MDDLQTDNPASENADNLPTGEPAASGTGTGANGGQAQGGAPTDDLFRGVDPNRLPPEAKAHYDSMLRDYREKTGKLSETIKSEAAKATEAYRQKAEFYDQIAREDAFVKQWNEYVQKAQAAGNPSEANADPVLKEMKQQLQDMSQKIQMSELTKVTEAFADATDDKGQKIHPEFDQLNSLSLGQLANGNSAEEFSLLRACVELAPGNAPNEKLANGYKSAKALYSSIFEAGKKAGMGRLQTKLMNGTNPPSNAAGEMLQVTEKKPKNAREAMAMARRGIVVSRD